MSNSRTRARRRLTGAAALLALASVVGTPQPVGAQEGVDLPAVLVTGASTGIGLRMVEVLSQNGFFVYAGARKSADLERLEAMDNVSSVRLDVTRQEEIDDAAERIRSEGRGLYGLVNNAGVAVLGPLIELPEEDMDFLLDINLVGPYRVTQAFADLIIESGGRILNVTSIAGILSGPYSGAYSMSKHGLEAYTDALAAELARFDVEVAAVEPGNYKSQILASMVKRMEDRGYTAEGSRYGSMLDILSGPLDRSQYEEPDDVALAALDFLTADEPKQRYMVVPNGNEAAMTIQQALRELAQLNEGHAFSFSRDELVEMLDAALAQSPPSRAEATGEASVPDLHMAALEDDLESLRQGITAGADVDEPEPGTGSTPLITAAMFGSTEVARALIEAGADVDAQNADGSTALITAAFMGRTDIVEALLEAGADRDIRNNAGSTALEAVTVPFESVRGIYDYLVTSLGPYGLELDYEELQRERPIIADMLR
jgi:NAD(P)-dependent dehydrogenase (short-subunit alcohol dehydrogenase family)